MRTLILLRLAHKTVSRTSEKRVITGAGGYARGLCVPHANLSELAVPRINAWRIPASRGEVNAVNQRHEEEGCYSRSVRRPPCRRPKNPTGCTAISGHAQEGNAYVGPS